MPVNPNNRTAERLKLRVDRCCVHDICRCSVDLEAVDIHCDAEVIQLVVRREHECLPDLPLGKLTVSKQCIDVDVPTEILCALCHARRRRNALPERARRHIHARRKVHIRMSLQT